MSLQKAVEHKLRNYEKNKISVDHLRKRLAIISDRKYNPGSASPDDIRVQGGGLSAEDKLIDRLDKEEVITNRLNYIQFELDWIDRGLNQLSPDKRAILEEFFIRNNRHALSVLIPELNYSKTHIYRLRCEAIEELTTMLYGNVD